jgi:hypothetical protein
VIGKGCFYWCKSLCEVTFEGGSKLKEIGESAFPSTAIKSIQLPTNVEVNHLVIGKGCFYWCKSLCDVTFEPGSRLKEVSENAFSRCISCIRGPVGCA